MWNLRRWMGAGLVAVSLLGASADARAAGPTDQATAVTLFQEARKLMDAGDFEHACPKFVEAQRLFPTPGTLLNIGLCYEKLGKLASAWGAYKQAEISARNAGDKEREEAGAKFAAAIAPRRAQLAIIVAPAAKVPGFELRRDGDLVGEGQWGSLLPVDVGWHKIEARAPGRKPWSTTVRVESDGSSASVDVPPLELAVAVEGEGKAPFWGTQRVLGTIAGGVGLAGLALGAVYAAKAAGKNSDSLPHCLPADTTKCDATGVALRDEAFAAAHVSTAAFIAGGALAAGGLALFLTAPRSRGGSDRAPQAALLPIIGSGGAGLSIQGRW